MTATDSTVLVLNASYEPLQRVSLKHAIKMLCREVAEVEEFVDELIGPFLRPTVVRLIRYVKTTWMHNKTPRCSKQGVLRRDKHTCAYCSGAANTVDHVLPRSRGGKITWENSVAACQPCNRKKSNRTPEEWGRPLLWQPTVPVVA